MIVLLGTPTAESTELYAQTVKDGDPSWAGTLAGVALNLSAYHIMEPEVKALIPQDVYEREVGFAELTLDGEAIVEAARRVREQGE